MRNTLCTLRTSRGASLLRHPFLLRSTSIKAPSRVSFAGSLSLSLSPIHPLNRNPVIWGPDRWSVLCGGLQRPRTLRLVGTVHFAEREKSDTPLRRTMKGKTRTMLVLPSLLKLAWPCLAVPLPQSDSDQAPVPGPWVRLRKNCFFFAFFFSLFSS